MKKFSKVILISFGLIIGAVLILMVIVNLWLQSGAVQNRLQESVENALGLSVRVRNIFYTPWSGVKLSGITIPDTSSKEARSFLEAQGFTLNFDLLPLFRQQFVISQITLRKAVLTWHQNTNGKWQLPTISEPAAKPITEARSPVPSEKTVSVSAADLPKFQVEIHKIRIEQSEGMFIDFKGATLMSFKGLYIEASIAPKRGVKGALHLNELNLNGRLRVTNLRANFTEKNGLILSDNVRGEMGNGKIGGKIEVNLAAAEPNFQTTVELQNVQFPVLIEQAGFNPGTSAGTVNGNVHLTGSLRNENDLDGQGHLELLQGRIEPPDFIQQLGTLLRVKEFQLLTLQKSYLNFAIRDQKFRVDDLTLQSENTLFHMNGYARFNGNLNVAATLAVNEEIQKQLRGLINENFKPSSTLPGYKEVSFALTGKVDRPNASDLWNKLLGSNSFGGVNQFFKGFFSAPQASPTPQGSPSN